jgi:hypothetical protein
MKQAAAKNKQNLAQYTWQEQITISLKGEEKRQEHFQVRLGPDRQPQKTSLDPPGASAPSGGRLKQRIVEKKKEEYKDYADEMKALVGITIASYMDDPQDAMNLTVQFSRLPDGTNHVSGMVIDGVKKQLNIATQNSNYQHA